MHQSVPERLRAGQRYRLKSFKKKKETWRTTHVYLLMAAQVNRCIDEREGEGTLRRGQASGARDSPSRPERRVREGESEEERTREGK